VHRNAPRVSDLREPVVRATAACIVRILGSQSPEKVSGGRCSLWSVHWGGIILHGSDVPDLRSATADRSEGSWQGILLWVVLVRLLYGEVPTLRLRVPVRAGGVREPRMIRWGEMMRRRVVVMWAGILRMSCTCSGSSCH